MPKIKIKRGSSEAWAGKTLEYGELGYNKSTKELMVGDDNTAVFADKSYIGDLPEGSDAASVVDYVDKKTTGIATETAVAANTTAISALQTKVGEKTVAEQIADVIGTDDDTKDSDTIKGAKKYADDIKDVLVPEIERAQDGIYIHHIEPSKEIIKQTVATEKDQEVINKALQKHPKLVLEFNDISRINQNARLWLPSLPANSHTIKIYNNNIINFNQYKYKHCTSFQDIFNYPETSFIWTGSVAMTEKIQPLTENTIPKLFADDTIFPYYNAQKHEICYKTDHCSGSYGLAIRYSIPEEYANGSTYKLAAEYFSAGSVMNCRVYNSSGSPITNSQSIRADLPSVEIVIPQNADAKYILINFSLTPYLDGIETEIKIGGFQFYNISNPPFEEKSSTRAPMELSLPYPHTKIVIEPGYYKSNTTENPDGTITYTYRTVGAQLNYQKDTTKAYEELRNAIVSLTQGGSI